MHERWYSSGNVFGVLVTRVRRVARWWYERERRRALSFCFPQSRSTRFRPSIYFAHALILSIPTLLYCSRASFDAATSSAAFITLQRPTFSYRPDTLEPRLTPACPSRLPRTTPMHRSMTSRHGSRRPCDPRRPPLDSTRAADNWSVPSHACLSSSAPSTLCMHTPRYPFQSFYSHSHMDTHHTSPFSRPSLAALAATCHAAAPSVGAYIAANAPVAVYTRLVDVGDSGSRAPGPSYAPHFLSALPVSC
jgi:hypothetical protein